MAFIYRFKCTSTTTVCPLGGLYIQVPLYINYNSVYLRWSLYTGSTGHQLLQCVPWVVFIYRFHSTSTTTVCPLGVLYIQVPLYINYYSVSIGWSLYRFQCTYVHILIKSHYNFPISINNLRTCDWGDVHKVLRDIPGVS